MVKEILKPSLAGKELNFKSISAQLIPVFIAEIRTVVPTVFLYVK